MDKTEVPINAQHFIECETCEDYSRFYCNTCHMRMCERCRDIHLDVKKQYKHEVVVYQERRKELPAENCEIHPKKITDLFCNDCKLPICSLCFATGHNGHKVIDFEEVYNEIVQTVQKKISKMENIDLFQSEKKLSIQRENIENVNTRFASLRSSMKKSADEISSEVNATLLSNYAKLDEMEKPAMDKMKTQEEEMELQVENLQELIRGYKRKLFSSSPSDLVVLNKDLPTVNLEVLHDIVEPPILPVFTSGRVSRDEISKQFGVLSNGKPKTDRQSSVSPKFEDSDLEETDTSKLSFSKADNGAEKFRELFYHERHKENSKLGTINLCSLMQLPQGIFWFPDGSIIHKFGCFSIKKSRNINNLGISNICHISPLSQGKFWLSDDSGNLIQCDKKKNTFQSIVTSGGATGYHAVTQEGELLYADKAKNAIYKVSSDMGSSRLISTNDWFRWSFWIPVAISSSLNSDILVGMHRANEWKITRYSKTGEKVHDIQRDNEGDDLYRNISHITENINGDICVSDLVAKKVVVVTKSGQFRFSYSGHYSQPGFSPYGICTDIMGHIFVCTSFTVPQFF